MSQQPLSPEGTNKPTSAMDRGAANNPDGGHEGPHDAEEKCCHSGSQRNLVVCIDGTSNQFGVKNTNVVELYSRLVKDETQLTYYDSGIGTYATPTWKSLDWWIQVIGHKLDLAFALRFERIIFSAYEWLSENYIKGDRIFLFGFSRGAYQVRAISGMIEEIGLILKGNKNQIPFAFELYAATKHPEYMDARGMTVKQQCQKFKETFSQQDVQVHFVGAWDTVSSVGIIRNKTLPNTISGMEHVCYFRHALALDERRVKFLPEYAHGDGPPKPVKEDDRVKEVWFAGSHSDIGGGHVENGKMNRFGPAIRWMSYEAIGHNLRVKPFQERWMDVELSKSLTWHWWLLELLPLARPSYKGERRSQTWAPHLGAGRHIQPNQLIHESVISQYTMDGSPLNQPMAQLPDGRTWVEWQKDNEDTVERDPYTSAGPAIDGLELQPKDEKNLGVLVTLLSSATGLRSIQEAPKAVSVLFRVLDEALENGDQRTSTLSSGLVDVLLPRLKDNPDSSDDLRVLYKLIQNNDWKKSVQNSPGMRDILMELLRNEREATDSKDVRISGFMVDAVLSDIRSGSTEQRFRELRDLEATEKGSESLIRSPDTIPVLLKAVQSLRKRELADNLRSLVNNDVLDILVKVSMAVLETPTTDKDWVPKAGKAVDALKDMSQNDQGRLALLRGDSSLQRTVCAVELIREHVRKKDERMRFTRTAIDVLNKVISDVPARPARTYPVSRLHRIVSVLLEGSPADRAAARAFMLNFESAIVTEPSKEHADDVNCVAVFPSRQVIASGSDDKTVRLWSSKTGLPLLPAMEGHEDPVYSVAFCSPGGQHIASGSSDKTIRIWNVDTGDIEGKIEVGAPVWAISSSPDGRLIASGGPGDIPIQIWDVETCELVSNLPNLHTAPVRCIAFSPMSSHMASGSSDETVRIWNTDTWHPVTVFSGHSETVTSVAFHPHKMRVVSCSIDGTIQVWEADTGVLVMPPLTGHTDWTQSAIFSTDGTRVISGADDCTIRVWNADTGQMVAGPFRGHEQPVSAVAFLPGVEHIVSGSYDNTVRIWDATGDVMLWQGFLGEQRGGSSSDSLLDHVLDGLREDPFDSMQFNTLRRLQSTASGRRSLSKACSKTTDVLVAALKKHWAKSEQPSAADVNMVSTLLMEMILEGLKMDPSNKVYIDALVMLRCTERGRDALLEHGNSARELLNIALGIVKKVPGKARRLKLTRQVIKTFYAVAAKVEVETSSVDKIRPIASALLESSSMNDHRRARRLMRQFASAIKVGPLVGRHSNSISSVSFSWDGKHVASGSHDGTVRVWDSKTGKMVSREPEERYSVVRSIAFSPDGSYIAIGTGDKDALLWEWEAAGGPLPLHGHGGGIRSIVFSPKGERIASGSEDNSIIIWNAETRNQEGEPMFAHTESVSSVAFSPDGTRIVSGSDDTTVRIWYAETRQNIRLLRGHSGSVQSVTFSPNSNLVISSSDDNTIRIWNAHTGDPIGSAMTGHEDWVRSIAISGDGSRLASGSDDRTIRIWDVDSMKQVGEPLRGHTHYVTSVAFAPDGERIVSSSVDKTVRIWDATGKWMRVDERSEDESGEQSDGKEDLDEESDEEDDGVTY